VRELLTVLSINLGRGGSPPVSPPFLLHLSLIMKGKYDFREPLFADESGLYITAAQMQFFLNRQDGQKKFKAADPAFLSYYKNCTLYNVVWDMMEQDSNCAKMYWDEKNENVAVSFPMKGDVADAISTLTGEDDVDENEDPYGIFH
jgi:hypothetical protein